MTDIPGMRSIRLSDAALAKLGVPKGDGATGFVFDETPVVVLVIGVDGQIVLRTQLEPGELVDSLEAVIVGVKRNPPPARQPRARRVVGDPTQQDMVGKWVTEA